MNKIKIAIIGSGYWGPNLLRNFVEIPNSEVVVVADLREDRLSQIKYRYPKIDITQNYRDIFSMGLDAVIVATPPSSHYKIAKECLQNNLHVLVEKPLTLNSRHAEELIEIADQKSRILMVGHTFEYNPAVRALKDIIDSGELGKICYVDSARLNLGLYNPELNVLWDLAPHDISILTYILGDLPVSVSAEGMSCIIDGVTDVAYLNLKFPNDILAHVHISWIDPSKVRRVTVVGSKKMVVYNDIASLEKIKIYDKFVEKPSYTGSYREFQLSYHYGNITIPYIDFMEPLLLECEHFLDCIANNQKPLSDGKSGLEVVKVLEAAQRSLDNDIGHEFFSVSKINGKNLTEQLLVGK